MSASGVLQGEWKEWRSARLAVAALQQQQQQQQQCHSAHYFKSRECLFHKTLLRALYEKKKEKKKLLSISNNFFSVTFGGNECAPSLLNLQKLYMSKYYMITFFFFLRTPMFISAITAKERDQVKAPAAFFSSHMKTLWRRESAGAKTAACRGERTRSEPEPGQHFQQKS